jgi:DNA-binding MarR family transcriptional regulator
MSAGPLLALEAQMRLIGRRVRRVAADRAAAVDPSLGEVGYAVLESLHRLGPSRQRDLVSGLCVEKAAVSRAVTQLVELGLVERVDDPDDGRGHQLALTKVGARRIAGVLADRRAVFAARLADWTPEEIAAFVGMLERYNAAIEGTPPR